MIRCGQHSISKANCHGSERERLGNWQLFIGRYWNFGKPISIANEVSVQVDDLRRKIEALPPTDEVCRKEYEASKEVERLSVECFLELAKTEGPNITSDERCALASILATIENRSALDSEADHRRWSEAMRKAFPDFLKALSLGCNNE